MAGGRPDQRLPTHELDDQDEAYDTFDAETMPVSPMVLSRGSSSFVELTEDEASAERVKESLHRMVSWSDMEEEMARDAVLDRLYAMNRGMQYQRPRSAAAESEVSATDSVTMEQRDLGDKGDYLDKLGIPDVLHGFLTVIGYHHLSFRIAKERELREADTYMNPFPRVYEAVTSTRFEVVVALVIVMNCAVIGVQASIPEDSVGSIFSVLEHAFVVFFMAELGLRVLAHGWVWIFEYFNFFDVVLVFGTGVLPKWVIEPLGADVRFWTMATVLRVLRLTRLVRFVRLSPFFKELWILTNGLASSIRPLAWTLSIAVIILYIFAVAGVEAIGKRDIFANDEHAQRCFGDGLRAGLTMFEIMTLTNWTQLVRPLMKVDSSLAIFFISFIGLGVFVFWNLVTAVIVENAYSMTRQDSAHQVREMERQQRMHLKALTEIFIDLDTDGSGELSEVEFMGSLENKELRRILTLLDLQVADLEDLWYALDDGDGSLTIREFTNGIRRMMGQATGKDLSITTKELRSTKLGQAELFAHANQFGSSVEGLEHDIMAIKRDTGDVVCLFQEVYHRLQNHIDRTAAQDKVALLRKEREAQQKEKLEIMRLVDEEDAEERSDDSLVDE